ncbi:MAG: hypothetical protein EBU90_07625 [Proteobacteria bacterium]|nr:hypothetical protein [Pseudomonadota bacterium]NBP13429.1 hypothetical protein [bacterium]
MAKVTSREQLRDYCLRELGHPVIEINVDDDQLDDRIDEAFEFYREYHYDAVELVYLKHEMTAGDIANSSVTLPDAVVGVNRIFPFTNKTSGINMFDVRYQLMMHDLYSLTSTDFIYYTQVRQQLELIQQLLVGTKPVRFNRHMNTLFIDMDWQKDVTVGDFIIVEGYRILDPNTYIDVYNDLYLKRYLTALVKKQWGSNLKKFSGVQLPGGVTLNGDTIYQEAVQEIKEIEKEIQDRFQLPSDMFVG